MNARLQADIRVTSATPVVHILNGQWYAGLERVVDTLAEDAPAHGFRVHLALLKRGRMSGRMATRNAILHACPMRSRFDPSAALRVSRLVRLLGASLIHSHTVRSALVARAVKALTGVRWVHHVHSFALLESESRLIPRINHVAERIVLQGADRVIAVSQSLADHVIETYRLRATRVTAIHNGVEARPAAATGVHSVPVVGCVGFFRPRKGLEVLLRAAHLLHEEGVPVLVRLVGEFESGEYRSWILRLIDSEALTAHVELTGFVRNVTDSMQEFDVFAFPSLRGEGLPMTLLEAMAVARPIVASRIPGVTEALNEECGVLVPAGDPQELARALRELIEAPERARALGARARERQLSAFSSAGMCKRVFDTYMEELDR